MKFLFSVIMFIIISHHIVKYISGILFYQIKNCFRTSITLIHCNSRLVGVKHSEHRAYINVVDMSYIFHYQTCKSTDKNYTVFKTTFQVFNVSNFSVQYSITLYLIKADFQESIYSWTSESHVSILKSEAATEKWNQVFFWLHIQTVEELSREQ